VVLLAAAALALAGCGRKGPLDLPPSASPEAVAAAQANADHEPGPKPSLFDIRYILPASPRCECQIQGRTGIIFCRCSLGF
jgi:predicted small lipoprotein YifL